MVTGAEFLMIVMALIDLEILFQMLPFVRMDGSGSSPTSAASPTSSRRWCVHPANRAAARRRPELKPWAKRIFIIYTLIVVPLIAFLVFLAIKTFPSVFATALDSGSKLAAGVGEGLAKGDWVAVAAGIAQIAILGLQVLGLGLVVFNVLKRIFVALWKWGGGSPVKRMASSAASLAIVALLVLLWSPGLPTGTPGPLYASAQQNFVPISPTSRGTLGDAVPAVNAIVPADLREPAPSAQPSATPGASPTPATSPSAVPSSSSTVTPFSTPPPATVAPTVAPTPIPTPIRRRRARGTSASRVNVTWRRPGRSRRDPLRRGTRVRGGSALKRR